MTRNRYSDYSIAQSQAMQMGMDRIKGYGRYGKELAKEVYKHPGSAAKFVGGKIMENRGKAGLALGGLALAGGLGIAGMKALGARKKRQANSLQGRLSSAKKRIKSSVLNSMLPK